MSKKKPKTNPNGANQYLLDPRQIKCWEYYTNPKSETFSNAYQSAIRAGYENTTSLHITKEIWFTERVRRINLLSKAEKVLEDTLTMDHVVPLIDKVSMGKNQVVHRKVLDPETFEPLISVDTSILKIKQDSAKFVAETQGKNEGYSKRSELTGPNGEPIINDEHRNKSKKVIGEYLRRNIGKGR